MEVIVFGGSGFIGSHVIDQFVQAGIPVTAVIRKSSSISFLKTLNVDIRIVNSFDLKELKKLDYKNKVVINCIAHKGDNSLDKFREVEVDLTKNIIEAAADCGAIRFIQLSSITAYGSMLPKHPIDESFKPNPSVNIEKVALEREQAVKEAALKKQIDYAILQPVSTIGKRDRGSFFSNVLKAHNNNKFPLINGGHARFSCVDTRDIGRAMVWLAGREANLNGETFLLKGFDTSWAKLKEAVDESRNIAAGSMVLPKLVLYILGIMNELFNRSSSFTMRAVHALTHDRIYDDSKIRSLGFSTLYTLQDSLKDALT